MLTKRELEQLKITPPDKALYKAVKDNWDAVAKPLDSMGEFEPLLSRIGAILGDVSLDIEKKAVVVMCADNGIVEEHISQSGQEVTAKVAASMGRRTSSVCRMAAAVGADVFPVDIGVNSKERIPGVTDRKVRRGTGNFLKESAMTEEEALRAIGTGMQLVAELKRDGYKLIATGEMGIGNTTTSSAVAAALLSCEVEEITGRGAGLSDAGLSHKIEVIRQALRFHGLKENEPLRILSTVGGLDIAGLTGVFIGGAVHHIPIVIDGVISAVAALTAERLVPGVKEYVIPSHSSREPAALHILEELGVRPVIDAGLALGEGTGAVMMFGLLDIARTVYGERTTFADIDMEPYERFC
ncbi:MAG: nicotinate-nucleotide--dimethylbenzimidazole phosphoribosyltransferase [Roseburia sp.]|nr:nicotinate-nucleotide--dimethylbenzimidazole phosphoribosyltransferase [Roseburia sp.]